MNIILNTDSYKTSHFAQYPPGTKYVSSYIESRGGSFSNAGVFFGLQPFLVEYLTKPITKEDIDEAETVFSMHGVPFNRKGWEHILKEHRGYLPIEIQTLPEGTVTKAGDVLVQIVNTDPEVPWLTSYIETALLRAIWYPTTVASLSKAIKNIIKGYMEESCDTLDKLDFMLNDFGSRGVSSLESSELGGMAHLISFVGTDNLPAVVAARRYYGAEMPGFSIPAAEHSTMTAWGRDREVDAYANMLDQFAKPGALVAVVSDSYDLYNAITNIWGNQLQQKVRDSGATVVIRPDSGDPVQVVSDTVELLMEKFWYTFNEKGYKVLPDCVRVIQGDGIDIDSIPLILGEMLRRRLSVDNIVFGMGGGLLQHVNRDTMRFAMKASAIMGEDNVWKDVYKDPVTDPGKRSKAGRLALSPSRGTVREDSLQKDEGNLLETVFRNGVMFLGSSWEEIKARSEI